VYSFYSLSHPHYLWINNKKFTLWTAHKDDVFCLSDWNIFSFFSHETMIPSSRDRPTYLTVGCGTGWEAIALVCRLIDYWWYLGSKTELSWLISRLGRRLAEGEGRIHRCIPVWMMIYAGFTRGWWVISQTFLKFHSFGSSHCTLSWQIQIPTYSS